MSTKSEIKDTFNQSHRQKVIVIDFDGTLCKFAFPEVGDPEPGVRAALQTLKDMGYFIKIHSCRTATYWKRQNRASHILLMVNFLEKNKIPFDEIIVEDNMDKPIADFYIDDRAISYKGNWEDVVSEISRREE
jgi:histidinol phosphatase-like enzyme